MRPTARSVLLVAAFLTFLAGPHGAAAAGKVQAVRHWSAPDHTRIVIDLSGPLGYSDRGLEDPPRIAVDIPRAKFDFPLTPIDVGDDYVHRIRFNDLKSSKIAQVAIDLEVGTTYDVFFLEKYGSKPDRIVVDVKRPPGLTPPAVRESRTEKLVGPDSFGDFVIVIDPGHGGEDAGRRNPDGLKEKTLALSLSKQLQKEIDSRPGYRAVLTRTGDYYVGLARRRQIAEQNGAHLFVSIHFNAAPSKSARGSEIFFVSLKGATDRAVRELETVENSADLIGGLAPAAVEGTNGDVAKMLLDVRQNDSVQRSQRLATLLTDRVSPIKGIKARKVKQAGFAVLKSLFIPAVLVEVGFLTNRDDVKFIRSSKNRARYVDALADGIVKYCDEVEMPRLGWMIHTVKRGETVSEIAEQYAMGTSSLREVNGLDGDRIRIGQKLRVRPR